MKKISILYLLSIVFLSCGKKEPLGPFPIKKGTQLIYDVENGELQYQFWVNIQKASEKGIDFDWKMTDPVNYSGKISISEQALKNANRLFNYFSNNSSEKLTDQTSVFLSYKVYDELVNNERFSIDVGIGEEEFIRRNELFKEFKIMVNGKEVNLEYYDANNYENNHVLRFAKIGNFPLIIQMHLDFSVTLKEVKVQ